MLTSTHRPRVLSRDRYLALELVGDRPAVFHQGDLTVHRGVEEQQAVQDVTGGEDLFCILIRHNTHLFLFASAHVCVCDAAVCGTSCRNGMISSMLLLVIKDVMFSLLSFPSSGHTKSALPSSNWRTHKEVHLLHEDPPQNCCPSCTPPPDGTRVATFTFLKSTTAFPLTSYFWNTSGLDEMANS